MPIEFGMGPAYNQSMESGPSGMNKLFYRLGRLAGPSVRKVKWIWQTATNSQAEAIKAEYEVGRDMAYDVRHRFEIDSDGEIKRILEEIGSRLAGCAANKLRSFSFESVKALAPQAFCLPGGFIFVSRSLVELCRWDKDEIAFILGHEMAHVMRGHAMERMVSNSAIAAAWRAAPVRDVLAAGLRKVGVKFLESAYSQDQELAADNLGVRLAAAAGYDARGSIRLLRRLATLTNESQLGSYLSSHPCCKARIANLEQMM